MCVRTVKELSEVFKECDEDMPIFIEVEKGVFKEFQSLHLEDTDQEYRVVLSIFSNNG